ncbi:putative LRR receptor-like serine/threonine-protein kinase [Citrus sinensis]|nr:putative LRR receptor-like serine/threonine-protein kinase [Citrus sinensis]
MSDLPPSLATAPVAPAAPGLPDLFVYDLPASTSNTAENLPDASKIELFNGENFKCWQEKVFHVLDVHNLVDYLQSSPPEEGTEDYDKKLQTWNAGNKTQSSAKGRQQKPPKTNMVEGEGDDIIAAIVVSKVNTVDGSKDWVIDSAFEEGDRAALQAFKSMIAHDPQRILNSWNDSRHFCEWEGVTCGRRHRRVIALDLMSKALSGSLSPHIGNLSFLREINLMDNTIQGEIPPEFGRGVCSGDISPFLGNLTFLEIVSLSYNSFEGNIPDSLGQLKELKSLAIGVNNLSGKIPPSVCNLSFLVNFSVSQNQIHGSLPSCLGLNFPNLKFFQIDQNFFTGSIPVSLSNASKLEVIQIANNSFSGKFSVNFGGMKNLSHLILQSSNLGSGESDEMGFINSLANCSKLRVLSFGRNQFRGVLSHSITNLSSQLQVLFLGFNQLYGSIPSGIGNLVNLYLLAMEQNQFIGTIPQEMGKLLNLQGLDFGGNHFSGKIPSTLGNLSSLSEIVLSNNNLSGVIPSSLGNLKRLALLEMSGNDLSGTIPEEIFNISSLSNSLILAQNHIVGSISPRIGNLKALRIFDVSSNDLSGEIPSELGLCSSLEDIYLLPKCTENKSSSQKISRRLKIIISTVSAFSGLVMVSFFIFYWHKWRREPSRQPSRPMTTKTFPKMSYKSLFKATDGFSSTHLIGVGSFEKGSVYKGLLDEDGTIVAIKVINLQRQGASQSFKAECKALKNIRHRNLVKVITSCSSIDFQGNDFKAIVYEYMPNGSLEKWLHPEAVAQRDEEIGIQKLTLLQRIIIAIDVASALDYLHHHCQEPILHCDLKPSNILLDNDLTAQIGDFGLARIFRQAVSNPALTSSVGVRGTIGYAAPEYGLGSGVSTNGDVYSYGILLLEMVTTKKPTDVMFEGDLNLHRFAGMALPDHVMDIVDPILLNDGEILAGTDNHRQRQTRINSRLACVNSMVRIGVACSMESPQDRMNITNVVHELQSVKTILLKHENVLNKQMDN